MKLFFCPLCSDIQKATFKVRRCLCKKNYAYLEDKLTDQCEIMHISPGAIPIALNNHYLDWSVQYWKRDFRTCFIQGWTIDPSQEANDCKVIIEE